MSGDQLGWFMNSSSRLPQKETTRFQFITEQLWTTSFMLWMYVVEYKHMLWSVHVVGDDVLWMPYMHCGDVLWTTYTRRTCCGWRYVVGDVFNVLSTTHVDVLHNTCVLWGTCCGVQGVLPMCCFGFVHHIGHSGGRIRCPWHFHHWTGTFFFKKF